MNDARIEFAQGRTDALTHTRNRSGAFTRSEALGHARAWRAAATDHGDASFYGAVHIRRMRAFWLGYARAYSDGTLTLARVSS